MVGSMRCADVSSYAVFERLSIALCSYASYRYLSNFSLFTSECNSPQKRQSKCAPLPPFVRLPFVWSVRKAFYTLFFCLYIWSCIYQPSSIRAVHTGSRQMCQTLSLPVPPHAVHSLCSERNVVMRKIEYYDRKISAPSDEMHDKFLRMPPL